MPNDSWDDHNIGMRLMVVAFTFSFFIIIIAATQGVTFDYHIIYLVGAVCLTSFIILAIGEDNTTHIIQTIIKKVQKWKK